MSKTDDLSTLFGGKDKRSWHTGKVKLWNDLTGANTITVEGEDLHDLPVLSTGAVQPFQPGDIVDIGVRGSQFFILGRIRTVGSGLAERIASNRVSQLRSVPIGGAFADLATSYGPEVTIYVGSSRRVYVTHSCEIGIGGAGAANLERATAWQAVAVSGASTLAVETAVTDAYFKAGFGFDASVTATVLVTSANGLNQGFNTFTCKYKAIADGSLAPQVNNRTLTVTPI